MASDLETFRAAPLHRIQVGTELTYRRIGTGPALLFIHGWPLNAATFRGLVRRLSVNYTCYVPDLPGTGGSPWDPRTQDIFEDWAKLLVRFVDALALDRVGIIAHDSGGGIARLLAAELGDRVSLLALTNTEVSGHVPPLVRLYMGLSRVPGMASMFRMLLKQRWFLRSPLGFAPLFASPAGIEGEFHDACVAPLIADPRNAIRTIRCVEQSLVEKLPEIHARISAPVVLVWGDADRIFPIEHARAMQSEFSDLRGFHTLPGYSLLVHDEAPDLVADRIEPLLRELHGPSKQALRVSA